MCHTQKRFLSKKKKIRWDAWNWTVELSKEKVFKYFKEWYVCNNVLMNDTFAEQGKFWRAHDEWMI